MLIRGKNMKRTLRKIYIIISSLIMPLFYNKEYLKGRWFENNTKGWRWCWKNVFMQKIIGYNRKIPFPVSHRNIIGDYKNLNFHIDDLNNFQNFGNYFQNYYGNITIGKGTYIAPNVGIITQNHSKSNLDEHESAKDVLIGEKCWIGMNSMILPGVEIGNNTIIGAGSVVTKSFIKGNYVVCGNPAKVVKEL